MATRSIVPRADNEGGIGTTLKNWATGFIKILNGITITGGANTFNLTKGTASLDIAAGATVDINVDLKTGYATVASHATTSAIWAAAGNVIDFTGTETITDFPAAPQAGVQRTLICAGACVFTHAGNITVQGKVTYTAAAGDIILVIAITTTTFKISIIGYARTVLTAKTAGGTLSATELAGNVVITNTGAGAAIDLTLQAGAADYSVDFEVTVAQYLRVTAVGANKFRYHTLEGAADGYIRSNTIGTRWRLTWSGGNWSIHDLVGILSYDE